MNESSRVWHTRVPSLSGGGPSVCGCTELSATTSRNRHLRPRAGCKPATPSVLLAPFVGSVATMPWLPPAAPTTAPTVHVGPALS